MSGVRIPPSRKYSFAGGLSEVSVMKVGDMVARKYHNNAIIGIVIRLFEIKGIEGHDASLPMAELMTSGGLCIWKRRKLRVISESR